MREDGTLIASFPEKIRSVTPGQEAVIYDGDTLVCGGKIDVVYQNDKDLMKEILDTVNA